MHRSFFSKLFSATAIAVVTFATVPAQAGAFSGMFVFGDSLSDTGNVYVASGGTQPPAGQPYFNGRFSNGPLWVETLAADLGLPGASTAYLLGGNNFAFGGARTGTGSNPPGVLAQVAGLWNGAGDPNALYVVVGGGNNMRDARSAFQTASALDQAGREAAAEAAVNDLISSLGYLAIHGAKHVLVSNLPNLGLTPEASLLGLQYASTDVSNRFDALMPSLLAAGAGFGLDMSFLDMEGVSAAVIADATTNGGGIYGITNVTQACAGFTYGNPQNACASSLFSDVLHPSAAAHKVLGAAAFAAVVPEPETYALLAFGLVAVVLQARRRANKAVAAV
jgi:outer membrane lipase/esterase